MLMYRSFEMVRYAPDIVHGRTGLEGAPTFATDQQPHAGEWLINL